MVKLTIDDKQIEVEAGTVLIQACEQLGVEIPRFCYHERLAIAGNCRMCLVEVSPGPPKPQASCALPVAEGMVVKTNSPMVKKAREGVMEFLLINHPLDCPICDQGGECDLQDQSMYFGRAGSRYPEAKRAVPEKYMGPLVKTEMTRCIHCTRCIRFTDDVAGIEEMGALNRGEHMEITSYLEKSLTSELSANVVDLCPVGALTSKPYAFKGRPWELKKTESIDVMDAVGSNIRIDTRGNEVMRILPRNHDDINEEWISDKTRHACDGLKVQRLDRPYLRVNGKLQPVNWDEAFNAIAKKMSKLKGEEMAVIAGDQVDAETMFAAKKLFNSLKCENLECRQDEAHLDTGNRGAYLFNTTIAGIEQADALLLIGTNPRWEAPLVNHRIRKTFLRGGLKIANIGEETDLNYKYQHLGESPELITSDAVKKFFAGAKKPMLIIGNAALTRPDSAAILSSAKLIAEKYNLIQDTENWNGFNILHTAASRVAGLDLGFTSNRQSAIGNHKLLYLLSADETDLSKYKSAFIIYQGHHGDKGAHAADVVLPGVAYTEKDGIYLNLEGRVQHTKQAAFPPGEAREDWKIIRALSEIAGKTLPFNTLEELRTELFKEAPHFAKLDVITPAKWSWGASIRQSAIGNQPFTYPIQNFYMTDPISRNSRTMAQCMEMVASTGKEEA